MPNQKHRYPKIDLYFPNIKKQTHLLLRFCLVQQNYVWVWFLYFSIMWGYLSKEGFHIQTKLSLYVGDLFPHIPICYMQILKTFISLLWYLQTEQRLFYFSTSIEPFSKKGIQWKNTLCLGLCESNLTQIFLACLE